jgi:hypothetical protein
LGDFEEEDLLLLLMLLLLCLVDGAFGLFCRLSVF